MITRSQSRHEAPAPLAQFIAAETAKPLSEGVKKLSELIAERHGSASCAVLHYGSCLRTGNEREGIVDLYLLVDSYRQTYGASLSALANRLLPPNVFYLEAIIDGVELRTKYALLSLPHFLSLSGSDTFNASIWARFSQPTAISWVRDTHSAEQVRAALACAVRTMLCETEGLPAPGRTARDWWVAALTASYGAELRPESAQEVAQRLVQAEPRRYDQALEAAHSLTQAIQDDNAMADSPVFVSAMSDAERRRCRRRWKLRAAQGKALNILRLIKAIFTFSGALEYALWKVERHSGVRVEASNFQKRWPLLGVWPLAWKLYRKGAFR